MQYSQGDPHDLKQSFWKALADSPFVMLGLDGDADSAAPMTAQLDKNANHAIWFFAHRKGKWGQLGPAHATFASKGHDVFARFAGTLVREEAREPLDRHWNKYAESWFPGGKDDPDLLFLRMDLGEASIWQGDLGLMAAAKLALGLDVRDEVAGKYVDTRL
jgi:general stress protein 26